MSTEAQLKAISNSELASGNQIPALKHRTVNNAIIEEMYDAQSRANVLAGVQSAVSIASGDQVLVIRSGQAYLLDSSEFGFVDALADLTDVNIPTPANDQVLAYNTSTSKWVAKDVNTLTSVVTITGTATTNTLTKFTGTSSIGDSILSDNGTTVYVHGDLGVDNNLTVGTINSGTSSDFVKGDGSLDGTTYQDTGEKGQANGYAPLDSGAKVAEAYLPDSILGQVSYQGTWAASTNTPTLANPPASTTKGEYYVTSVAGTQFSIDFQVGDWIISNGTAWEKVDNTDAVTSVFGRLGNVVANAGDYASFYVSLDTTQTITGQKTFQSGSLRLQSEGAANTAIFRNFTGLAQTQNGFNFLGFNSNNDFYFSKAFGNAFIFSYNNSSVRTYALQDASGTLAFTSDINDTLDSVTDRGATTTNTITVGGLTSTGGGTFSDDVGIGTSPTSITSYRSLTLDGTTGSILDLRGGGTLGARIVGVAGGMSLETGGATPMNFSTNGTERMTIDSWGSVGIAITPSPWDSTWRAIQLNGGSMYSNAGGTTGLIGLSQNWYYDGLVEKYINSAAASDYQQLEGEHRWFTAPTGTAGNVVTLTEAMRIDSTGNVGIGTASPSQILSIASGGAVTRANIINTDNAAAGSGIQFLVQSGGSTVSNATIRTDNAGNFSIFSGTTSESERMRIDSSGNVGIAITSTIQGKIHTGISSNSPSIVIGRTSETSGDWSGITFQNHPSLVGFMKGGIFFTSDGSGFGRGSLDFCVENSATGEDVDPSDLKMRITSSGNVGIGNANPSAFNSLSGKHLVIGDGTQGNTLTIYSSSAASTAGYGHVAFADSNASSSTAQYAGLIQYYHGDNSMTFYTSSTPRMTIDSSGNVSMTEGLSVTGSLSKGSGSFKIDHPLPEKKDTHHLVHSFVEAPQADNIYRGKVELLEGKATVNLDEAGRMTEGTFVLLNGNIQCFTSNESGWTAIRGKVEGNVLTIEAQDTECTDTVSWLVIGERIDQHMIETEWTDENGRVITEPLKKVESTPENNEEEEVTI